jgi:outer membrane receptor protein involved in Fe transport
MKQFLIVLPLLILSLFPLACLAQEANSEKSAANYGNVAQLDSIVVTASKLPQTKGNVTQKVDVISEKRIDETVLENRNIAEALQYEPGIFVNVLSRNDANWGSYGGLGPKHNTYLLDGLPIDSFVDPQALDPWALARIETQKGPALVLYPNYLSQDFAGNQSPLAGTTNFILKERTLATETRGSFDYGSYNTATGHGIGSATSTSMWGAGAKSPIIRTMGARVHGCTSWMIPFIKRRNSRGERPITWKERKTTRSHFLPTSPGTTAT